MHSKLIRNVHRGFGQFVMYPDRQRFAFDLTLAFKGAASFGVGYVCRAYAFTDDFENVVNVVAGPVKIGHGAISFMRLKVPVKPERAVAAGAKRRRCDGASPGLYPVNP